MKKIKKIKKIKRKKKIDKKIEKNSSKKLVSQSTFKSAEDKVEIKKIKKQPTEKKIYNVNDYVVYIKKMWFLLFPYFLLDSLYCSNT